MREFLTSEESVIAGALRCYLEKEDLPDGLKLVSECILDKIKQDLKQQGKEFQVNEIREKDIVRKSIFRQKTYAKRCYVRYNHENYSRMYETYRKNIEDIARDEVEEFIEEKTIFSCDLSIPILENYDKFFIEELDMMVTIQDSFRTSKDEIVYYIEPKYIEDEKTTDTYNLAMEQVGKCERMQLFIDEVKNNKIYQRRIKKNIKSDLR
jgi:hypothetical protein